MYFGGSAIKLMRLSQYIRLIRLSTNLDKLNQKVSFQLKEKNGVFDSEI